MAHPWGFPSLETYLAWLSENCNVEIKQESVGGNNGKSRTAYSITRGKNHLVIVGFELSDRVLPTDMSKFNYKLKITECPWYTPPVED